LRWRTSRISFSATRATVFDAVNKGWVSITRPWHLLTTNSGAGNPHAATAEKGRQCMAILVERLAGFLVELSAHRIDAHFPYRIDAIDPSN
jgi:creatinine amidohydrolase